jgi:hypothetical protein
MRSAFSAVEVLKGKIMKLRISMALLALLTAAATFAQPAPGAGMQRRKAAVMAEYLQLTPDQIAAWKQINADTAVKVRPLRDELRAVQKDANQKRIAVLTPEQKAKLEAMRAARMSMRRSNSR